MRTRADRGHRVRAQNRSPRRRGPRPAVAPGLDEALGQPAVASTGLDGWLTRRWGGRVAALWAPCPAYLATDDSPLYIDQAPAGTRLEIVEVRRIGPLTADLRCSPARSPPPSCTWWSPGTGSTPTRPRPTPPRPTPPSGTGAPPHPRGPAGAPGRPDRRAHARGQNTRGRGPVTGRECAWRGAHVLAALPDINSATRIEQNHRLRPYGGPGASLVNFGAGHRRLGDGAAVTGGAGCCWSVRA